MKYKSEVAQVFWKFKARVENESNFKIQILRSYNSKEYTSAEFNQFVRMQASNISLLLLTLQNKMELVRGEIDTSWR